MNIPRVALLIETSNAYARGLLEGITQYVHERGPWSVFLPEGGRGDTVLGGLRGWKGEGIIARIENKPIARAVAARKLPTVDLSAAGLLPTIPWVHSDVRAEAAAAFSHLWDRGFRRLGFCGVDHFQWSSWQRERFKELAEQAGCDCSLFVEPASAKGEANWVAQQRAIIRWLRDIPKPVGIFACYDIRGQQVLEACRESGIRVPDEVAVVGVDNDPVRCGLSDPPLSSVVPDTRRAGYLAAELLAAMIAGKPAQAGPHLVDPLGVFARRSSDSLAVDDPEVRTAARFIRDHACEPIGVKHVLRTVPISRRALESRFIKLLGRTPHEEIVRCRMEQVRQLLCATDLPIKAIAQRVGIGNAEYLSVVFKKSAGWSPAAYRKQHGRMAGSMR